MRAYNLVRQLFAFVALSAFWGVVAAFLWAWVLS